MVYGFIKFSVLRGRNHESILRNTSFVVIEMYSAKSCGFNTELDLTPFLRLMFFKEKLSHIICHHGVARPQIADGGDGLQIWRVAANILNLQSWTADKGWSFSLGGWAWG
jgi:hypothetical protein